MGHLSKPEETAIILKPDNDLIKMEETYLTVGELLKELETLPKDLKVIVQMDGQENAHSPLLGVDPFSLYAPMTEWSGHVYSTTWTAEQMGKTEEEWEEFKAEQEPCVLLYPVI